MRKHQLPPPFPLDTVSDQPPRVGTCRISSPRVRNNSINFVQPKTYGIPCRSAGLIFPFLRQINLIMNSSHFTVRMPEKSIYIYSTVPDWYPKKMRNKILSLLVQGAILTPGPHYGIVPSCCKHSTSAISFSTLPLFFFHYHIPGHRRLIP